MITEGTVTETQKTAIEAILDERGMTICARFIAIDDGGKSGCGCQMVK